MKLPFLWAGLALVMAGKVEVEVEVEDEEGDLVEDLSQYKPEGEVLYKTLWQPRDCAGPAVEGDSVTMMIEYTVAGPGGGETEKRQVVTSPHRRPGLLSPCLGERRRLSMPRAAMEAARATDLLPDVLVKDNNLMDVEVVGINNMTFSTYDSGLLLSVLEPVDAEYCNQTVEEGDTLYVDYEGSLEDGTVFDSSAARNAPFGPFVHGRGQIIQGYTEVLTGRCLGERWRMVVPPHLAYGDSGVGEDIPPKATLTFDVRLVQHNQMKWSDEVKTRKVFGFEEVHTPKKCKEITKKDELYIHYEATREDGSQFGSLPDQSPPYGPTSLVAEGLTGVVALDRALPGMCLGASRLVTVPPRLGWTGNNAHHDTIRVLLVLVKVNGVEAKGAGMPKGPPRRGDPGDL